MNIHLKKILFLFISQFIFTTSFSQNNIEGIVTDEKKIEIEFANVTLFKANDLTTIIAQTTTDSIGYFTFKDLESSIYNIEISYIGYNVLLSDTIFLLEKNSSLSYDYVLSPISYTVEGIVVTSKRPSIIHEGGKTIVNLENTLSSGNSLIGVLKKLPSITTSNDGINISGQKVEKIFINGRSTNYLDIQSLLNGFDGESISKVELIYQPDATLEASGTGPFINIILKKNKLKHTHGYLSSMFGKSINFIFSNGIGINTFYKNISLSVNSSYRSYNWSETSTLSKKIHSLNFDQSGTNFFRPKDFSLNSDLEYFLTTNHTIGISLQSHKNNEDWNGASNITREADRNIEELLTNVEGIKNWNYLNLTPYFEWSWKEGFLRFDTRYLEYKSSSSNDFKRLQESTLELPVPVFEQNGDNYTWSYKLDFSHSINPSNNIQLGIQYDLANLDNQINHFQAIENINQPINKLNNRFIIDEKIVGAYTQYKFKKDKIEMNFGIRWEGSNTKGKSPRVDTTIQRKIKNIFPSYNLSFPIKNNLKGIFSYSYRINRPTYSSLNPFKTFFDPLFSDAGNPVLIPEYIHSLQFRLLNRSKQIIRIVYSKREDYFFERVFQNDEIGETTRQLINIDNYHYLGMSLYFPIKYSSNIFGNLTLTGRYQQFDNQASEFIYNNSKWSFIGSHNFEVSLPKKINLEGNFWFGSGRLNGMMETAWYAGGYLGVNRSFLDKKLKISLEYEDFISRGFRHSIVFENINSKISNRWNFHKLFLRMRYSFGKNFLKNNSSNKRDGDGLERF